MEKVSSGWRTATIVLSVIVVLFLILFTWGIVAVNQDMARENDCVFNICGDDIYNSYYYDEWEKVCYCFTDGELAKTRYMG